MELHRRGSSIRTPGPGRTGSATCRAATSRRSSSPSGSTRACRILLIDEPTRGVDVGAKREIYALLRDLAARGVGDRHGVVGAARGPRHQRPDRGDARGPRSPATLDARRGDRGADHGPRDPGYVGLMSGEFTTVYGRDLVAELPAFVHRPYLVVTMDDLWPLLRDALDGRRPGRRAPGPDARASTSSSAIVDALPDVRERDRARRRPGRRRRQVRRLAAPVAAVPGADRDDRQRPVRASRRAARDGVVRYLG